MIQLDPDIALLALQRLPTLIGLGDEPMWAINKRSKSELKALIEQPFQEYGGEELYKTPAEKVAVLFFQTIKGHKFENGNKRTAVVLALAFLRYNGYWLHISPDELYDLALKTAGSANNRKTLEELNKVFDEKIERVGLGGLFRLLFKSAFKHSRDNKK